MVNIFERIVEENRDWNGAAILDGGTVLSYPELFARTRELAQAMRRAGIRAGMNCALLAADSADCVAASLAVLQCGAALAPISTRAPLGERAAMLRALPLDCVIADRNESDGFDRTISDQFTVRFLPSPSGKIRLPEGRTPAFIRFSSGTTGKSKGVVLSHEAVLERTGACRQLAIGRGEKVLWVLDMAFHFVVTILLFLRRGATIVICPAPVEMHLARMLREHAVTLLYATPYHYRLMAASDAFTPDLLPALRLAVCTAMKLPAETGAAFRVKFGHPLNQAYGIIELGLPCVNSTAFPEKSESVGRIQAGYDVRIDRPDADGVGEILIRGPGMFDAYWEPFRLRETVCRDGYFVTGDLGRIDSDGFLYILGRTKNVIIFAGMKIFPYEVESVLLRHPDVAEVRVTGIPDEQFGELPTAEIVLRAPAAPAPERLTELRKFCYENLAAYKVPKSFSFVANLPKTASGKIRRD